VGFGRTLVEKRFEVSLPDVLLAEFDWPEAEVAERVREALIMELVRLDRISEAQAGDLLELDRWALLDVMGRYEVPAVRIKPEDIDQELTKTIKRD
jgi:metal-responsive CopG/Arc/MetJ family transcriptional regulator